MDLAGREGILTPGTRQWQRAVLSVGLAVFCSTLTANRRGWCRPCLLRHTEKPRPRRHAEPARRTHRNPAVLLREWNFPAWRGHAHRQPTDVGPRTEGDVSAVNLAFGTPGPDAGLGAESGVPRRCPREASFLHHPAGFKTSSVPAARNPLALCGTGAAPVPRTTTCTGRAAAPGPAGSVSTVGRGKDRFHLGQTACLLPGDSPCQPPGGGPINL